MNIYLISEYVNRMQKQDVNNFAIKQGITLDNEELDIIMGKDDEKSLYIGKSPIYENRKIYAGINDLFSNHMAIFGNSGSGKSCSVSRIIQNIFLKYH